MALPGYGDILPKVRALQQDLANSQPARLQQESLHEFIDKLQLALIKIHTAVSARYF